MRSTPVVGRVWVAERDHHAWATRSTLGATAVAVVLVITGVPSLDLHGPLHHLGVMDPLCGGTRAMFLLLTGQPTRAASYNPIVFPLAAGGAVLLLRATVGWATRRWFSVQLSCSVRRVLLTLVVGGLTALEIRQQLHADLLTQPWP